MKKLVILMILWIPVRLIAQPYGDEWVDYNKQYWRIPIAGEGIFTLTYEQLQAAGFPVATVDPRRIQLFGKGTERAIQVSGQADASFDSDDFILFYGQPNDGTTDTPLYPDPSMQPHQLYSLFSDTSAYFLTYSLSPLSQGRRMSNYQENNTDGIPAEPSSRTRITLINRQNYAPGVRSGAQDLVSLTTFDQGEGWTGNAFQEGNNVIYALNDITNIYPGGNPQLDVLIQGRDNVSHVAEVLAGPDALNLRILGTETFEDYESRRFTTGLAGSDISAFGELNIRVNCLGETGGNDLISVSYVQLEYDEYPDMQGLPQKKFRFMASAGSRAFVEITNVPAGSALYDVSDPDNVIQIGFTRSGSTISAIIRNADTERTLLLTSTVQSPQPLTATFREIDFDRSDYIIITHSLLRKPAAGYTDPVLAYASYRASAEGGAHDTVVVNIRTLYDQFSYGITSPLAIYNFVRKFVDNGNPQYLFLIGKGTDPSYDYYRNTAGYWEVEKFGYTYRVRDLVPSAGNPGGDMAFSAGLGSSRFEAAVATGRLPAVESAQVAAYLEKVMEMEAQPYNDLYRKSLLHLSGGISAAEIAAFRVYMDGFGSRAADEFLGGEVTTIQKDNTNPVQLINISDEVNAGVSLVTFFGHSSSAVTDIDIGYVSDPVMGYNNTDKYPMFLVNGCLAGQFFQNDVLFGEDWINAGDAGATGFIAHSSFGYSSALRRYSDYFYETAFNDSVYINKPIGNVQQETGRKYQEASAPSDLTISQVQQMVLLGDPAARLFNAPLPDYAISDQDVAISAANDRPLTSQTPAIRVRLATSNFGRTDRDSLAVRITRTLPGNELVITDSVFMPVFFRDTLQVIIPNAFTTNAGNNELFIQLDPDGDIDELNENNNSARLSFFLPSNATVNLYPQNFSIQSTADVQFITQSADLLGEERSFSYEIDTAATFDSPVRQSGNVSAKVLAIFEPGQLPLFGQDSITYFWRTRFTQPDESESDQWQVSSFSIIESSAQGWTQRVFPQFTGNQLDGLVFDNEARRIEFDSETTQYSVFTAGADNPLTNEEVSVLIDNVEYNIENQYCRTNTLNFIAFNRNSSFPFPGLPLPVTDSRICGRQPQVINSFTASQANAASNGLVDYINALSEGDYVTFFTIGFISYSALNPGARLALESMGVSSTQLESWINGEAVIVIGRKGAAPGSADVTRTPAVPASEQEVARDSLITGYVEEGSMRSSRIGPAQSWGSLDFAAGISQADELSVNVTGISLDGSSSLLYSGITETGFDLTNIDAAQYPFLELSADMRDPGARTAPQLFYWQAIYQGVPEGVLLASSVKKPPVESPEGAAVSNSFSFVNISGLEFPDSLEVLHVLKNPEQQQARESVSRIAPPMPGDSTVFTIDSNTTGLGGLNDYSVFVNPRIIPELYYDNNNFIQSEYLNVLEDGINPLIDVVFDGAYILDGDIVSPSPLISIKIIDENKIFPKQDTTGISLRLRENCESCQFENIRFSSPYVQWFPATENEPFRIEYKPPTLGDGIYTLSVQASDASGNQAGDEPYLVNFEVINESTITNFYPYPNPFSTSTRFVFTLTGAYVPDGIKIQILTVTGKVVREITTEQLGPIRIGNNITQYAWDGRDEYGDQLANGVYLYRVILDTGSNSIERRSTAGDKAFDKGFGKLYILR